MAKVVDLTPARKHSDWPPRDTVGKRKWSSFQFHLQVLTIFISVISNLFITICFLRLVPQFSVATSETFSLFFPKFDNVSLASYLIYFEVKRLSFKVLNSLRLRLCHKNHRCRVWELQNTLFSLGFFESHCHLMVTYVGPTVLKRKLLLKLQQFWAEKELSIFFFL